VVFVGPNTTLKKGIIALQLIVSVVKQCGGRASGMLKKSGKEMLLILSLITQVQYGNVLSTAILSGLRGSLMIILTLIMGPVTCVEKLSDSIKKEYNFSTQN
jgi:hypothetical protein